MHMPRGNHMKRLGPNKAEDAFRAVAAAEGWRFTRRGWPDFILLKDNKIAFVEVKPRSTNGPYLSGPQWDVMKILSDRGFRCLRWAPDIGYTEFRDCLRRRTTARRGKFQRQLA